MKRLILSAFALFGFSSGAYATDIQLAWTAPTEYEDGTALTQIDRYVVYYSVDNTIQPIIEVQADVTNYTLVNVAKGSHTFQIATVSEGVEGAASDPVNIDVSASKPVKIELTVRVID